MTISGKYVIVYDWFDIKEEICKEMGIEENQFYRYHDVVGGDYKNLWDVSLQMIIPDNFSNDTILRIYKDEQSFVLNPDIDWGWNNFIKENGDWVIPFIEAYQKVFSELNGDSEEVYVEFAW